MLHLTLRLRFIARAQLCYNTKEKDREAEKAEVLTSATVLPVSLSCTALPYLRVASFTQSDKYVVNRSCGDVNKLRKS